MKVADRKNDDIRDSSDRGGGDINEGKDMICCRPWRNHRYSLNIPLTDLDGVQREGQIIGCHGEALLGSGEPPSEWEAGSHFLFPIDDGVALERREVTAASQSR